MKWWATTPRAARPRRPSRKSRRGGAGRWSDRAGLMALVSEQRLRGSQRRHGKSDGPGFAAFCQHRTSDVLEWERIRAHRTSDADRTTCICYHRTSDGSGFRCGWLPRTHQRLRHRVAQGWALAVTAFDYCRSTASGTRLSAHQHQFAPVVFEGLVATGFAFG